MYLILSNTRAEAANYARQQGWSSGQWQSFNGAQSLRNIAYTAIHQLDTWKYRGDRHARNAELRRYLMRHNVERIHVDGDFRPAQYVAPEPGAIPAASPKLAEMQAMINELGDVVAEVRERNSELQEQVYLLETQNADLEERLRARLNAPPAVKIHAPAEDWKQVATGLADAQISVFDAIEEDELESAPEPVIDRAYLEGLKKPALKILARKHGIHVTSQTPATLVDRILEARELNGDG